MSPEEQEALWRQHREAVRRTFAGWLRRVVEVRPQRSSFQIIQSPVVEWDQRRPNLWEIAVPSAVQRKFDELCHQPRVPVAKGTWRNEETECQRIAARLRRIGHDIERRGADDADARCGLGLPTAGFLNFIASKYDALSRCYYVLPGLTLAKRSVKNEPNCRESWQQRLALCRLHHDSELAWACTVALQGVPEPVSTFYVEPLYSILRPVGGYLRVLRVISSETSKSWTVEIEPAEYKSPEKMREALNQKASGTWLTGGDVFNKVVADWQPKLEWESVELVTEIGEHNPVRITEHGRSLPASGAWFFGDGAITAEGVIELPDEDGIIRVRCANADRKSGTELRRFKVAFKDESGLPFHLGRPEMHLAQPGRYGDVKNPIETAAVRTLFAGVVQRMFDTIGNMDALAALGIAFAYGAASDVFGKYRQFPGLWFNGESRQGKTTFMEWLGAIWGVLQTKSLTRSTGPGGESMLQQFSNLPVLLDEAQSEMKDILLELAKDAYERKPPAKMTEHLRRVNTNLFISGVATSKSVQLRSRYYHILVSRLARLPKPGSRKMKDGLPTGETWAPDEAEAAQLENYNWLAERRGELWMLGRWILENRNTLKGARSGERGARSESEGKRQKEKGKSGGGEDGEGKGQKEKGKSTGEKTSDLGPGTRDPASTGYAPRVMELLQGWLRDRETLGMDARAKFVHGVAYAGFRAMAEALGMETLPLLGVEAPLGEAMDLFRRHLFKRTRESETTAQEGAELDQFLRELHAGFKAGIFGENAADRRGVFKAMLGPETDGPPGTPEESVQRNYRWTNAHLLFRPSLVFPALEKWLRGRGLTLKLSEADIRAQIGAKPGWVTVHKNDRQRFAAGERGVGGFWRLNLNDLEIFGRREITDDEFEAAIATVAADIRRDHEENGMTLGIDSAVTRALPKALAQSDPRKGPLYEIVDAMLRDERAGEDGAK